MGPRAALLVLLYSVIGGCSLPLQIERKFEVSPPGPADQITAVAVENAQYLLVARRVKGRCELLRLTIADKTAEAVRSLPFCPDRLSIGTDGSLLILDGSSTSLLLDRDAEPVGLTGSVIEASSQKNVIVNSNGHLLWRHGEETFPLGPGLRDPTILPRSDAVLAISKTAEGESIIKFSKTGNQAITPAFPAVDSYAVSPDEKEIVLSADQGRGFDVALASLEREKLNWIFPDRLAETTVSWAPRGNKVSYVIETDGGSILRTVHVPTSFALTVDFPLSRIQGLSWEPKAEKLAVLTSSFHAGSRIEWLKYGGEEREVLLSSGSASEVMLDRLAGALLEPPPATRYEERYALVVWVEPEDLLGWRTARQRIQELGVASAVVSPKAAGENLWEAVRELAWVDQDRVIVVYKEPPAAGSAWPAGFTVIIPSPDLRDTWRIGSGTPRLVRVPIRPPEEIEAFAVDWIEQLVKGSRR